jgi:glycosyltransferase involved in cell wall biosynthesis
VDPIEFLRPLAFLVVPSLWDEPMGRVVPEAFSVGTPVLGARRGGIPEMVTPGVNGALFEPDRPKELGLKLLDMETKHSTMEAACLEEAKSYSRDRHVAAYERIYAEAMSARARTIRR